MASRPRTLLGKKKGGPLGRGFTLVELLLVLGVMTLLTSVFLFQQSKFDSSTLLRSLSYSVALSVRQAQVYGTSVYQFGGSFASSFGLHFNSSAPGYYVLFADTDKDGVYDSPGEHVKTFTLGQKFSISNFCATSGSGGSVRSCVNGPSGGGTAIQWLNIFFTRPNPEANFKTEDGSSYSGGYVQLVGAGGTTRSVTVTSTGQISVGGVGS